MAVAADSGQMAARNQTDTPSECNHRDAFYAESHFYHYDAPTDPFGFNKNSGGRSRKRSCGLLAPQGYGDLGEGGSLRSLRNLHLHRVNENIIDIKFHAVIARHPAIFGSRQGERATCSRSV